MKRYRYHKTRTKPVQSYLELLETWEEITKKHALKRERRAKVFGDEWLMGALVMWRYQAEYPRGTRWGEIEMEIARGCPGAGMRRL